MGLVLAEEERQAQHLKSVLRATADRLEHEIRRADKAVSRAEYAEMRAREMTTRVTSAESGKQTAELDATRAKEEAKRYQLQCESLERQLKRMQADASSLQKLKVEADESASRARDTARKFQVELKNLQEREEGREESRRFGMHKWFKSGRAEGFDAGHLEGFEEGREEGFEEGREVGFDEGLKAGRKEGFNDGWEQGLQDEREHALKAFDKFLVAEFNEEPHALQRSLSLVNYISFSLSICFPCIAIMASSQSLRRKGPKNLPSLPLSAFTPPNTGTSERFPLPPTPGAIFPDIIIDSNVAATADLSKYKSDAAQLLEGKVAGVVLNLQGKAPEDVDKFIQGYQSNPDFPVLSLLVPFSLDGPVPTEPPSHLSDSANVPTALTTTFVNAAPQGIDNLRWALKHSRVVDIDVQGDIMGNETVWETFEELLTKATVDLDVRGTPIVLSNVLPPPHDLDLHIVTLMKHPTYRMYQAHTAALSLFPNLHVKFIPPLWNATTPPTPHVAPKAEIPDTEDKQEWKRRIKMYIGPVLEAFGFERIIFGSSPSPISQSTSNVSDWYELVREAFAELGVEQEAIDSVFSVNAKRVYGSS
ncbi:hypothetical protein SERLA73DRAFT_52686 [Serpula lacrymans var. lacrymans S7.3]|uniref:Uncharacterized protein n=1 Tax=Serpula lacrymans var. lacrymans (strain S7.3) TaxID=936435 RepID=F8PU68_SERL3|nr:hypothetical protein SERLA73DRAFT_52686 [Serpula lacrymans var. lacrymans S7.3]